MGSGSFAIVILSGQEVCRVLAIRGHDEACDSVRQFNWVNKYGDLSAIAVPFGVVSPSQRQSDEPAHSLAPRTTASRRRGRAPAPPVRLPA